MNIQRILLRLTLAFLAAAALAAVFAVISGSTTVLWRIVGTCVEAAVATGVVVRLARWLDADQNRIPAFVGFASLFACFAFFLLGTWLDLLGFRQNGRLIGSGFAVGGLGAVGTAALAMRPRDQWDLASRAIAIAAATTLAFILLAIWCAQNKLGTAAFAAGPLLILAGAGLVGANRWDRPWRLFGVLLALAAACIGINQAYAVPPRPESWSWYASLAAASVAIIHANLLMLLQLPRPWPWVRLVTIAMAVSCAIGVALAAFATARLDWNVMEEAVGRITAAAGILAACGTLGLVARQKLGRRYGADSVKSAFEAMEVVCPRCATKQTAPVGESPCVGCRMVLSVQVREPRCAACGYCLLDLQEDQCPECGHVIPARGQTLPVLASS